MIKVLAVGLMAFALNSTPSHAGFFSGNELVELCRGERGLCNFYVTGLFDSWSSYGGGMLFCVDNNVRLSQIVDLTLEYIRRNPAERHEAAAHMLTRALAEAFPCKNN